MISDLNKFAKSNEPSASVEREQAASLAIFGVPKPFDDPEINRIQRNAFSSWRQLEGVDVILLGGENGIQEAALEFDFKHSAEIRRNDHGTPMLSDAFRVAAEMTEADVLIYCNCDVMLFADLVNAIAVVQNDERVKSFVAFGRRTDLRVEHRVDFANPNSLQNILQQARREGSRAPVVCKEYFAFTRDLYREIPDFAVGRGNWDNWMIAHAKSIEVPVIDFSPMVNIIHQEHGYSHLKKKQSRLNCYVSGDEARENQMLAGGKNIIGGSTGTWTFGRLGLRKNRASWLNGSFWLDLPRFARFVVRLPFER